MIVRRRLLWSILGSSLLLGGGCNLIFGVQGGELTTGAASATGSGGAASASSSAGTAGATSSTGGPTGSSSTGGSHASGSTVATSSSGTATGSSGTGGGATCAAGRTPLCNPDGGASCTAQLIDTDVDANDLGISGDHVFYTTGDGNKIRRILYDGTGGVDFPAMSSADHLTVVGTHVYWTDYYGSSKVKGFADDGTGLTTVAVMGGTQQIGNGSIATDPTGALVYWTSYAPPALWRAPSNGSQQTATLIVSHNGTDVDAPTGVAVDDTYAYWGDTDGVHRMKVASIGGANPVDELFAPLDNAPVTVVRLDTDRVYWTTSSGDVRSQAKSATGAGQVLVYQSGNTDTPMGVAVDEAFVYWISLGGVVQKAAKGGATILPVSSGPPLQSDSAGGLAVDCGAVYWAVPALSAQAMGRVYRSAKGP